MKQSGATALDALQQVERKPESAAGRTDPLESIRIKIEADIGVYEKTENLYMAPEQIVAARTEHINSDPMIDELSTNIVQMERELIAAQADALAGQPDLCAERGGVEGLPAEARGAAEDPGRGVRQQPGEQAQGGRPTAGDSGQSREDPARCPHRPRSEPS